MMVVHMARLILVLVNQAIRSVFILVVRSRMQKRIQPRAFPGANRDYRNPEHFRQTVHVDFHPAFFHNIHHI